MPCASESARRATPFAIALLAALAAILPCLETSAADLAPTRATLCTTDELVVFSCLLGPDVVSLCATRRADTIGTLSFREGRPNQVTNSYVATTDTGRHFKGTVSVLAPRALVRQVWFERDGLKTLLSECVGGDCPHQAAQGIWRGDRLVSVRRCRRTADDRAWFSHELVKFGSDVASSRTATPLLQLDDIDNGVEALYPITGGSRVGRAHAPDIP